MKPGPPRKPRIVQELMGNPSRRPLRNEPKPLRRNAPRPPSWLSPYALEEWKHVVDELVALGLAAEIDQSAIAAHCENVSMMRASAEVLLEMASGDASRGLLAKMPSGAIIQNPILGTYNKARMNVLRSAAMLGLCSTGRANLDVPDKAPDVDDIVRKYFGGDKDD